ncbi:hypothetical protein [Xanthocytophaga agilis]|uniref:Uncharacterized protein n=1 Tax=Xanthocytophaga agilis TaxID=3048010 RepID=A0AAE3UIA9_9BACT|nr:hypothetical protein [Xanthocytophaga agilis]MDJ1506355.1 hypothetical protein [Xanthocytophaga agilis]
MFKFIQRQGCLLSGLGIGLLGGVIGHFYTTYWLITLGVFVVFSAIKIFIEEYRSYRVMMRWLKANEGKRLLFYAGRRKRQKLVEDTIIPALSDQLLKVYYDGPSLAGDIPTDVVLELMKTFEWRFNQPVLAKVVNRSIRQIEIRSELGGFVGKNIGEEGLNKRISMKNKSLDN